MYENAFANVTSTVEACHIGRSTFYKWKKENATFREIAEEIEEGIIDYVETRLIKNIQEGKEASLIFFLKTRGKKRGYIETTENIISGNPFEELMKDLDAEEE